LRGDDHQHNVGIGHTAVVEQGHDVDGHGDEQDERRDDGPSSSPTLTALTPSSRITNPASVP